MIAVCHPAEHKELQVPYGICGTVLDEEGPGDECGALLDRLRFLLRSSEPLASRQKS